MVIFPWVAQITGPTESQTLIQKLCGQAGKTGIFPTITTAWSNRKDVFNQPTCVSKLTSSK